MLELAIRKRIGEFTLALALTTPKNQIVALFGPSGAGKSITLAAIAGFVTPDAGRIVAGDHILFDSTQRINLAPQHRRIGLVKQNLALFPHLTVAQNIAYGLWRAPATAQRARVEHLARLMRLEGLVTRYPAQLSGGQQQRVALARALAPQPGLLLLDEPFSALDAPTRAQLRGELLGLQRELQIPMVFVTHDLGEAYFLADQLAVIDAGKILQADAPGKVLSQPDCLPVARALGVKNILPGEIVARTDAGCRVRIGAAVIGAPTCAFAPGTRVYACIRAERVMLLRADRAGQSSDENALDGEIVRAVNDGMTAMLDFRATTQRLAPTQDYDLQIELPVYIYERLNLARQRAWTVSLRRNAIHLIRRDDETTDRLA